MTAIKKVIILLLMGVCTSNNTPFSPNTVKDWNDLSEDVSAAPTLESFCVHLSYPQSRPHPSGK